MLEISASLFGDLLLLLLVLLASSKVSSPDTTEAIVALEKSFSKVVASLLTIVSGSG